MPIYAYKCSSCGHAQDVLQKVSDAPLTRCPQCDAEALVKQLTAAGFQLRGSGWYATDFKNGPGAGKGAAKDKEEPKGTDSGGAAKSDGVAKTDGATKTDAAAKTDGAAKTEKASSAASASGSGGDGGRPACS